MDYAEAANKLNDELAEVWARAERRGLSDREIANEFRRVADENDGKPPKQAAG